MGILPLGQSLPESYREDPGMRPKGQIWSYVGPQLLQERPGQKLKPVPYPEGRERPKKEADRYRLVSSNFNKWRNLFIRLVLGAAWQVDVHTIPPSSKFIYRPYWVQSYIPFMQSQPQISISRLCPWGSLWEWGRKAECTSQGQGRDGKPPIAWVELTGQLVAMFL